MLALALITTLLQTDIVPAEYGEQIASLPVHTARRLAEAHKPTANGAIGRNRAAYFHVRFQLGMHHLADYGLAARRADVIDRFLTAVEFSLQHQQADGDYRLVIPDALKNAGRPSVADRASGVAFFASSLGLGLYALETNGWFQESDDCAMARRRVQKIKPRLRATLDYLLTHQQTLKTADAEAPNRLLFDALAFESLGRLLSHKESQQVAASFVVRAVSLVDAQEGYFIEGGGFDSSYNAVATALALRLLMMDQQQPSLPPGLRTVCKNAVRWQQQRVLKSGEVSTAGNSRVKPGEAGESFLGKKKGVDVGHIVEAFLLASHTMQDESLNALALHVLSFYEHRGQQK
ncbi:MAG: hypothetical protein NXI04_04920 [Planctomycetaceae bacterium]|nr:hypothetical protein [Planctomycetaceae bacterium]